jgi:signal transduction histidine kinase
MIDFTSRVAVKIHAPLPEAEIYRVVCSEFAASKRYSANIVLLADGGSMVTIGSTCLCPAVIGAAEKAARLKLRGYHIDLAKARSWAKVVLEGQTVVVGSRELLIQWLPGALADILLKILGYEGRTSVLVPIKCRERRVGGLAVSCAAFDPRVVPSVEALAAHISSAVTQSHDEAVRAQIMSRLRDSERTLRSLLDAIPESALLMDVNGMVLATNSAVVRRLHTTVEDLVGACAYDFLPADVAARRRAFVDKVVSTGQPVCFWDMDRGRRLEHHVYPVKNEPGMVTSLAILGIDTTERSRMEKELAEAVRFSSLGLLAAGIAHDIRNPLAVVHCAAQLLEEQSDDADQRRELSRSIQTATQRVSAVVEDLLKCSTPGPLEMSYVDVSDVLERTLAAQAANIAGHAVEVQTTIQPALPPVWANHLLLQEAFSSLTANACDAMTSGGTLEIVAERDREGNVEITFRDTGCGIAPEDLTRVFDPFFTTKQADEHSGMGLFTARHIVKQHRGTITVQSYPGVGTTFVIHLPCQPRNERAIDYD